MLNTLTTLVTFAAYFAPELKRAISLPRAAALAAFVSSSMWTPLTAGAQVRQANEYMPLFGSNSTP